MPYRSVTWTAIDAARLSRFAVPAEVRRTNARTAAFAKLAATRAAAAHVARPLVVAGQYDRTAIMAASCAAAKARQGATGEAWAVCMAGALMGAWQAAKQMRARTAH